jgi:hypothetical protein
MLRHDRILPDLTRNDAARNPGRFTRSTPTTMRTGSGAGLCRGGDTGRHSDRTTFEALGSSETRVDIRLGWEPVGVVEKAEAVLNFDQHQVEKSAANFKEFIESRDRETGARRGDSTKR